MNESLSDSLAKKIKETIDENDLPEKYKEEIDAIMKEKEKTPEGSSGQEDNGLVV